MIKETTKNAMHEKANKWKAEYNLDEIFILKIFSNLILISRYHRPFLTIAPASCTLLSPKICTLYLATIAICRIARNGM